MALRTHWGGISRHRGTTKENGHRLLREDFWTVGGNGTEGQRQGNEGKDLRVSKAMEDLEGPDGEALALGASGRM